MRTSVFLRSLRAASELVHGAHEELVVFRNFDHIGRLDAHMGRVGVLLVHLGRGEIVDQAVHAFAAGVLERIVELVAGLAVVLLFRLSAAFDLSGI